jgi:hypothetical protein
MLALPVDEPIDERETTMWAFFSRRLRTWLILSVAVPLGGALARAIARRLEERRGASRTTRALYQAGDLARRGNRGPDARAEVEGRERKESTHPDAEAQKIP